MSFRLHCRDQALPTLIKAMAQTQKKLATVVYRAGTKQRPWFDFDDKIDHGTAYINYSLSQFGWKLIGKYRSS